MTRRLQAVLAVFLLCVAAAVWQHPDLYTVLVYGFPTWVGGTMFTLLVQGAQDRVRAG